MTDFLKAYDKAFKLIYLPYDEGFAKDLEARYSEGYRYYHNTEHILRMLDRASDLFRNVGGQSLDRTWEGAVQVAILYHDAVYIPGFALNEKLSADMMVSHLLAMNCNWAFIAYVAKLIRATKNHGPSDWVAQNVITDSDLYELGTDRYHENGANIWREAGCPDLETTWKDGRRAFLTAYLGRSKLFHLPGQGDLERHARTKMKTELQTLGGCPNDTDSDGCCGKRYCPFCGDY